VGLLNRFLRKESHYNRPKPERAGKRFLSKRQLFLGSTSAFCFASESDKTMPGLSKAPSLILRMPQTAT
jgi:hypothetical protein